MNLIKDKWLPVKRASGLIEEIAPLELTSNYNKDPIVDIVSPRSDFKNCIYQLLIGVIQVVVNPSKEKHWIKYWETPLTPEELNEKFNKYEECFEIDSDGPAFMQDYKLTDEKNETLKNLFIELPANDHFHKEIPKQIDIYWAAIALYSLQTLAPAGGRGTKTGLRGGGPLTSLLIPEKEDNKTSTLWEKIWINIITQKHIHFIQGDRHRKEFGDTFPWMKPTKVSSGKDSKLEPIECHPYHTYFGMPRRIRLTFSEEQGICDITGKKSEKLVIGYKTFHSGNDYSEAWRHPLNSYRVLKRGEDEGVFSVKAQPGGITYRNWMGFTEDTDNYLLAANIRVAKNSEERKNFLTESGIKTILWTAGYDMNNMKARCWYESKMPVYSLDRESDEELKAQIGGFIDRAEKLASTLRSAVKAAWFNRPGDKKGDMSFLDTSFWQETEYDFYMMLEKLVKSDFGHDILNDTDTKWNKIICNKTEELFDTWALTEQESGLNMKRVLRGRGILFKEINKINKTKREVK